MSTQIHKLISVKLNFVPSNFAPYCFCGHPFVVGLKKTTLMVFSPAEDLKRVGKTLRRGYTELHRAEGPENNHRNENVR